MAERPTGQVGRPGPRPRKAWLRAGPWIAAAAIAVALAVWWSRPTGPPFLAPLPDPNGYDDVLQAALAIEGSGHLEVVRDIATIDDPERLRPFVEANSESLELVRLGLSRPFRVPVTLGAVPEAMAEMLRQQGAIRYAGRALFAAGRLARLEGRPDDAARAFLDLLRLGHDMGRDVPMLPYLVGLAMQRQALAGLRDLRDDLDGGGLRAVITALDELERDRPTAAEAARRELQFMDANVAAMGVINNFAFRVSGQLKKEKARVVADMVGRGLRDDALRRLLRADLAIHLYRSERGEAPDRLDDLVPDYLDAPPIDPYADRPLIYRKTAEGYRLYSVGPDRRDDNLAPTLDPGDDDRATGDLSVDSL